jgi:7-keto-8-aminopelargonate synthetase-like enzyme
VDIHIGTLSKAFGAMGGFVATSTVIKALVLNKVRSFFCFGCSSLCLAMFQGAKVAGKHIA